MNHLLLLEDDAALAEGLAYALPKNGFEVTVVCSVTAARTALAAQQFDVLLLDVNLPDGSGFALCEALRCAGDATPILFLTAADEEVNIIRGLDSGGDDYLTKPFRLGELCSRVRALLRRAGGQPANMLLQTVQSGALRIDLAAARASLAGRALELTAAEYRLLCLLVRHPNQTLTRTAILDALWDGSGDFVDDNTLSVYVRRLREKIEDDPSHPQRLCTVRGLGYRWQGGDADAR